MTPTSRRMQAGVFIGAAAICLFVAAFGVAMVAGDRPSPSDALWFCSFVSFPLVGVLVLWHRPDNLVGWVFVAVGAALTTGVVLGSISGALRDQDASSRVGAELFVLENVGLAVAFVLATTYPLFLYPDGRLPSPPWRWVLRATTLSLVCGVVALLVKPGRVEDDNPALNPLGIAALGSIPARILDVVVIGCAGVTLLGIASLVVRWRRGSEETRRSLSWLVLACLLAVAFLVVEQVASSWLPDWVGAVDAPFAVVALPVATAVAVLRSRLFDVQSVLDRTLVYGLLVGLVVLVYVVIVDVIGVLVGPDAGTGAALLAASVIAVVLTPAKEFLQARISRLLYGDRSRPYIVLSGVAAQLEQTTGDDDLLSTVTGSIARSLKVPYVTVADGETVEVPADAVVLPLVSHGRQEGVLLVGRRSGGRDFNEAETKLLTDLARQVAVEKRLMRLAADLQESRERIVHGREEERLRVRRDLHDGIGPTLAAASLQCDALRDRWPIADPAAAMLLGQVKAEIGHCVLDVRRVVDGLRPPALDDLGLVGVVREHAATLTAAGLEVDVRCPEALDVPSAAVEVAAYRIVTEAMTNVVRHARASRCVVTLGCDAGWLRVQVTDDGVGLGASQTDGIGLASMRERAAELGGVSRCAPRRVAGPASLLRCRYRPGSPRERRPRPGRRRPPDLPRRPADRPRGCRSHRGCRGRRRRGAGRRDGPQPESGRRADGPQHAGLRRDRGHPTHHSDLGRGRAGADHADR
jgi:signal transduction histidine kinase